MSHPILDQKSNLLYYLFIWIVISVLHSVILHITFHFQWGIVIRDSITFNLIYAIIALSFWYNCKFISLEKENMNKVFINHILASIVSTLIWLGLAYIILIKILTSADSYQNFFRQSILWRSLIGILFYFVMISLYYLIIYYQNFHQKLIRESELKSLVKEAELKTLKFQINPHFIFNSLNSINALIRSSPEKAGKMTVMLGDFLRSTLSKNEGPLIDLTDELKRARLYLNIEKVRFGEKINYFEEVDQKCVEIKVPTMILQPLFENAIKHGVYESIQPVTIKLTCKKQNNYVKLTLENDFDPNSIAKKGEGIGLENIRSRMQKVYNQNSLFVVEKESNLFKAILYIPLVEKI